MPDSHPPAPEEQQDKSGKIRKRLIWLGIILAILGIFEIGYMIKSIVSPASF